jgi:endonuclease/exonuclease/phosphatase family metal-dependent hydrolase
MKLLQWNVNWKSNPKQLIEDLARFDADIMCLQEVTRDSEVNPGVDIPALICDLGYEMVYQPTIERSGDRHKIEGVGVFSKFKILDSQTHWINRGDSNGHNAENYDRALVMATVDTPDGPVTVGSTHLSMTKDFAMTEARRAEIDRLVSAVQTTQGNLVIAGDFNAAPDSYAVQSLSNLLEPLDPSMDMPSFPTIPFRYHDSDFTAAPLSWRIDYMFGSSSLQMIETQLPQTMTSDHLPILTTIK